MKFLLKDPDQIIIKAIDVHKIYYTGRIKLEALSGVNLKVPSGKMIAIMGPSGCGKTTLLNCLSTLDDVTSGKIEIEGQDLFSLSDNEKADLRSQKMGFIFQQYNLLPVLSALENVELPLMVSGHNRSDARTKAIEALELVGLSDWAQHKPPELSGGQSQRVTIARSLINKPKIVFADEPTGNLDSKTSGQIMDLLCKLNKDLKQTYVIVTHDSKIAKRADKIYEMESGKLKSI